MLDYIKRMAAAAFSLQEIAEVCEVEFDWLQAVYNDKGSDVYKAYRSGYLQRQLELRERIFKDARNGSSPAQTIAYKLLDDVELKNTMR